tara:strand:- start:307 stop:477 length:171 start_codon:yes stop_codon:yes gene_type:complete
MSRVNLKTCTLEEMEEECQEVKGTAYGHNIIGIICSAAEERFGETEAERLFKEYQG